MSEATAPSIIVRASERPLIEGTKSPLVSRRLLTNDTFAGAVGVTWIKLSGAHAPQNSGSGERFYYILTGRVDFRIAGEQPATAEAGDIVYLPKNVDYTFEGDITYLL